MGAFQWLVFVSLVYCVHALCPLQIFQSNRTRNLKVGLKLLLARLLRSLNCPQLSPVTMTYHCYYYYSIFKNHY